MKVELGRIYDISSGGTPSKKCKDYYDGGKIKWVKTGDLKEKYLYDTDEYITQKGLQNSSAKLYPSDTVLVAMYGATIGATSILKSEACTNQACAAFIKNNKVIPEYLYYFFKSKKEKFIKEGVGGAQPNISAGYLRKVKIDLISIGEQRKIVKKLGKIDELIGNEQEQIRQFDILLKSRFVEMFGDININNKGWDVQALGELCTIIRGGSPRPIEQYLGGDIPWIKIGDATDSENIYLNSTKEHIIREGVKKSRMVKAGSLIFANCGVSLGFARIITFDGCIHDGWLAMEDIDSQLDKVFLLQSLNQMTDHFRKIAPEGTQPNLNTAIMKNYMQIIPPLKLQKEFITFSEQIDKLKFEQQQQLEKTQILFDSLMQQYFG